MDLDVDPREVTVDDTNQSYKLRGGTMPVEEALWRRKEDEAYASGVMDSVEKEGVVNPVELTPNRRNPRIMNGYHRVASVNALDKVYGKVNSFVPVTFKKNEKEAHNLPVHWQRDKEYLYPEMVEVPKDFD